jgi:adenosylcobinamide-phosphate synthase
MSLLTLIAALLLEQVKPLYSRKYLNTWLSAYVEYFRQHFHSGVYSHGKTAWWLATAPIVTACILLFSGLHYLHPILAWSFNVLVLYLCLGFGQYNHAFTEIQLALRNNNLHLAHEILSTIRGQTSHKMTDEKIARITIEVSLLAALHYLFGVIVWFLLFSLLGLAGSAGALLYCLSITLGKHWIGEFSDNEELISDSFAKKMSIRMAWLPIRLTASTFAIVGNFEDTVYCWRTQAVNWGDSEAGILLASAAGASGVRLGMPVTQHGILLDRPQLGIGEIKGDEALHCAKRLVWRSVVFMLIMLFMLSITGLLR